MSEIKLQAENRTEFGKGAARRIRREAKVPAVLYGHGTDPVHLTLPGHELMLALKNSNALLSISLGSDDHLALPKQVQRDPIKGFIEHADLLIVRRGEKVVVEIPVHVTGDVVSGSLVVTEITELSIEAEATHIPESIEISVEGLDAGATILAGDIELPEGSLIQNDPEQLVVNVVAAPTEAELEAELEEAEAEAGIERDESEDEAAEAAADGGSDDDADSSDDDDA